MENLTKWKKEEGKRKMARVKLSQLREQRLPKYTEGMNWKDFQIKFLMAAGTRGRCRDALEGLFIGQMPKQSRTSSGLVFLHLTPGQEAIKNENDRAYADLVASMPNGRLTTLMNKAKTEEYPEGCAGTAWEKLVHKLDKKTADEKRRLKELFESGRELPIRENPAEHLDKLIEYRDQLVEEYECTISDEDVVDQLLRVVNDRYEHIGDQIKQEMRLKVPVDLDTVRDTFEEKFLSMESKRKKKGQKRTLMRVKKILEKKE